ncbi:MBL fold metallo-hydrolase [Patescibacteria group bacterium]
MQIHKIVVGALETNCYIVVNDSECVVIDPGDEAEKIIEFIEEKNLKPTKILLTHKHFDHVGALEEIKKFTTSQVVNQVVNNVGFLETIKTPGHTQDSVCFVNEKEGVIFTGDTLFEQGIGRTDLEGGDYNEIQKSLKRLMEFPDDFRIYPGHGPDSTIGEEKPHLHF